MTAAAGRASWHGFKPRFAIGRGASGVVYLMQSSDGRKVVDKRIGLSGLSEKQRLETQRELEGILMQHGLLW